MSQSADNQGRPPTPTGPRRWRVGCPLLSAALAGVLVLVSVLPRGPQHALIRRVLEQALAAKTHREVSVGAVRDVLWGGVAIEGFRLSKEGGFARGGTLISVRRARVRYSLLGFALHRDDPLKGLRSLVIDEPDLEIRRDFDGEWELAKLFGSKEPSPEKPFTFAGRMTLRHGRVRLIDQAKDPATRLPPQTIGELTADARFDGRGHASVSASFQAPGLVDRLAVSGARLTLKPFGLTGAVQGQGFEVATLGRFINRFIKEHVTLLGGRIAGLDGQLAINSTIEATRKADEPPVDVGLNLTTQVADVSLISTEVGLPIAGVTGAAQVQMALAHGDGPAAADRIDLHQVAASVGHTAALADGSLLEFRKDLRFDLRARSNAVALGELAQILPKQKKNLVHLTSTGATRCDVRLTGPVKTMRITGWAEPAEVSWADLATLHSGRVRVDLRLVAPSRGLGGVVGLLDLDRVAAHTKFLHDGLAQVTGQVRMVDDGLGGG